MSKYKAEIYLFSSLLFLILLLFFLKSALIPFFIASSLAYISWPLFNYFKRLTKGRETISALLTVASLILAFFVALFIVLPTVVEQVQSFVNYLPSLGKKLDAFMYSLFGKHFLGKLHLNLQSFQEIVKGIYSQIGNLPIGDIISKLFSGVFSAISIAVNAFLVPFLTYYFLKNGREIFKVYIALAPEGAEKELKELLSKVHDSLSSYLIGQMGVALFVGFYITVGLYIVGIKYFILIGFISGLLNMIPYVGFFSGLIPSLLLALFDNGSWKAFLGVLVVFLTEVGIENLIYPLIMSRTTGVNPILILLSIFIGGYLGGFLGIVLAVPVAVIIVPIFDSFLKKKESLKSVNWDNG
ncbi:AI-2E family transporter [Thermovibrio sp.]